jgi:hypothetical protein
MMKARNSLIQDGGLGRKLGGCMVMFPCVGSTHPRDWRR